MDIREAGREMVNFRGCGPRVGCFEDCNKHSDS
jgi:hypothetical protein